jgi:O-methyltransferase
MVGLEKKRTRDRYVYSGEYIRCSSLELIAHEINDREIKGCVAELGVYKGDFAKYINRAFPDRKFYLFDTFDGFDERDIKTETEFQFSAAQRNDFKNEDIALVLGKMKYPDNCIIRKGYFPETAKDLDEKFVFVSIDVDLFEPIYQGLCFFSQRLQHGGCIFVHDYHSSYHYGVNSAVKKFSAEQGIPYFPLSDSQGSVVFMK